jgi:vacuolar-type H+-ATPase subunit I/STV1
MQENFMTGKAQYQERLQAQLDEWGIDLAKLKAKAAETTEDARLEMDVQLVTLETKLEAGKQKLAELADTSEDAWGAIQDGLESAWGGLKTAFGEAAAKFKD